MESFIVLAAREVPIDRANTALGADYDEMQMLQRMNKRIRMSRLRTPLGASGQHFGHTAFRCQHVQR